MKPVATKKRISRVITKEETEELLKLTPYECCKMSVFMNLFASFEDRPAKFNTYDIMTIPAGTFGIKKKNKNAVTTTVGRFFFNRAFIEEELLEELGYVNKPLNKKTLGELNRRISYAVNEDRLPVQALKNYILKQQKFQAYTSTIAESISPNMFNIAAIIRPKKEELCKKYAKEIAAGDSLVADKMEKELLDYAKEVLGDDPCMDYYDSGVGSWGNNFKNMYVMKGAQKDAITGKYNVITSNYADGVSKDEYSKMANSLSIGPYSRANKTAIGGWNEKRYVLAFQEMKLGPKGSDCGTNKTITVTLEGSYLTQMMYSYIVEGNRLVRLDSTNMDKYKGKTVKMRFASLCHGVGKTHDFCNKCIGDYFYIIGMENVGIATAQLQSTLKNIAMKACHDGTLKYTTIDLNKAFPDE